MFRNFEFGVVPTLKFANLCCSLCRRCNNRSFRVSRVLAALCWTNIVSLVFGVMHFWFRLSVTFSLESAFSAFSVGSTRWFSMVFSTSTPKVRRSVDLLDPEKCEKMTPWTQKSASIQRRTSRICL